MTQDELEDPRDHKNTLLHRKSAFENCKFRADFREHEQCKFTYALIPCEKLLSVN